MLQAHGKSLFDFAVLSFARYFDNEKFVFIVRPDYETPEFVTRSCKNLGIANYEVVILNHETRGQAETVFLGLQNMQQSSPITVFNIDTFRFGFAQPDWLSQCDGYLEVFKGDGDNWSYAKPKSVDSNQVVETAEKNPISDLCSTGLYYFAKLQQFNEAFAIEADKCTSQWQKGELYIAPMYNTLIQQGLDIRYNLIERDDVFFCGVPQEYDDFKEHKSIDLKLP